MALNKFITFSHFYILQMMKYGEIQERKKLLTCVKCWDLEGV